MRMIFIDRGGHARSLRDLIRKARVAIGEGRSLVIFPEGTRVAPGKKLRYRPGVAALYSELGVPVVPVVHNSGLYWPKSTFRKYPGTVIVEVLPPIPPGLERHTFMTRLEATMEEAATRLIAEAQGLPDDRDEPEERRRASAGA